MGLSQEFLAVKLYEMEKQYGKLQSRLLICGEKNHLRIREELERARDEYQEQLLTLQREVEQSRSQAVKTSGRKKPYRKRMERKPQRYTQNTR